MICCSSSSDADPFRIARAGEFEAAVSLPEDFAASAGEGEATVTLWSKPDKHYRAKLRELSPSADATTRTFAARASTSSG